MQENGVADITGAADAEFNVEFAKNENEESDRLDSLDALPARIKEFNSFSRQSSSSFNDSKFS